MMAANAIVILALFLQGVYSRPQDHGTSDTTSSGVTINVEGSTPNGISDIIREAVVIPVEAASVGVSGAQLGVDSVRQFLNTLFGSARTHTGSGSVQMSLSQPAWSSIVNLMQQGEGAAAQGTESANQMMSGIMSLMNQPQMMTMFRQMVDSGVLTQGEGATIVIDSNKVPREYANQLTSMFGTSNDGTVTIDLAQPGSWGLISTLMQRGMTLARDGIAMGMDAAKIPIEFASHGIDMMKQIIPGQSGDSVSISAVHPASSMGSFGNPINRFVTNGAQMKLDAMNLPIDAANNGIGAAREFMTGSGTEGRSSSVTINSGGTESNGQGGSLTLSRTGMSGLTNAFDNLINSGAGLADVGLQTAGLGVNMAGTGIDTTRNLLTGFLGARPVSISGRMRTPSISFSTRTRGY